MNKIVIGIESKVHEEFGDTISERIRKAEQKFKIKPESNAVNRIRDLSLAVFGKIHKNQSELRYQLLHGIAVTVAEAIKILD